MNDETTGYSPYPGNINQLLFKLEDYVAGKPSTIKKLLLQMNILNPSQKFSYSSTAALDRTKGIMPEFVNPKYADAEKTVFKKPTRLECMMQVSIFDTIHSWLNIMYFFRLTFICEHNE